MRLFYLYAANDGFCREQWDSSLTLGLIFFLRLNHDWDVHCSESRWMVSEAVLVFIFSPLHTCFAVDIGAHWPAPSICQCLHTSACPDWILHTCSLQADSEQCIYVHSAHICGHTVCLCACLCVFMVFPVKAQYFESCWAEIFIDYSPVVSDPR